MSEDKAKTETKETETPSKAEADLKVFNFTRDGIVVRAKNRKEAEKLYKEQLAVKSKKEDK